MNTIEESPNAARWPRLAVKNVETRKRDLVIRIADWSDDDPDCEPAYDVECYIGGIYDWNESKTFSIDAKRCSTSYRGRTKEQAKEKAIRFAQEQIARLL